MSHEGYTQCICQNGHYFEIDAYFEPEDYACKVCSGKVAWSNSVDETNGFPRGKIPYETLKEKFLKNAETCNFGHSHSEIFRIPSRGETRNTSTKWFDSWRS